MMLRAATKFRPERKAFQVAQTAGFQCAELWLDPALLADSKRIGGMAREFSFLCVLHFPNRTDLGEESLDQAVRLYRNVQCHAMVIHQPQFDLYANSLLALDSSINLAIENHVLEPAEFDEWVERSPGLTLDVEHLWKFTLQDSSLDELITQVELLVSNHGDRLYHVHLPGYLPGEAEHRPLHHSPQMASEVLNVLAEYSFEGLVVSEANEEFQNPADLQRDLLFFESWSEGYASARSGSGAA